MELFFLWVLLCAFVGVWASKRGLPGWVLFFASLLITPLLGALIVFAMGDRSGKAGPKDECGVAITPETHVKCPDCRSFIQKEARKCKHCGAALVPQ